MKYAIISDIHGNRPALEAVLANIQSRGIEKVINLGDFFFGAIDPEGTAQIIRQLPMAASITGNKDRDTLDAVGKPGNSAATQFVLDRLSPESLDFLRGLSKTAQVDNVFFACHGTPDDDNNYLTENVDAEGRVTLKTDDELLLLVKNVKEPIILCGHSHVQRLMRLSNGKIILNPGSVGLPAYIGSGSPAAIMESYTPFAKYALVHLSDRCQFTFDLISCPYDWERSAALARENGNSNWAQWIKTGRALKKK